MSSRIPAGDYCQALTAVRFLVEYPLGGVSVTRWLRRLARLGVSVRTPLYGVVLAEFPAGRQ